MNWLYNMRESRAAEWSEKHWCCDVTGRWLLANGGTGMSPNNQSTEASWRWGRHAISLGNQVSWEKMRLLVGKINFTYFSTLFRWPCRTISARWSSPCVKIVLHWRQSWKCRTSQLIQVYTRSDQHGVGPFADTACAHFALYSSAYMRQRPVEEWISAGCGVLRRASI